MNKLSINILFILLAVTFTGCATNYKRDPWTMADQALYTSALALHCADWLQTRSGVGKYGLTEQNLVLGENPDVSEINVYFTSTAVGLSTLAWYAPKDVRKLMLLTWGFVELVAVLHNSSIGVAVTF